MVANGNRIVKSAPTSANGSTNLAPKLDITVNHPVKEEDSSSEESDDSVLSKEKR